MQPRHVPALRAGPRALLLLAVTAALYVAGCAGMNDEEQMEASQNTFTCKLSGEPMVVRFVDQEARMLMPPDAHLVTLYQLPTATGVRYSNGAMELRGAGTSLRLTREDVTTALTDCEPLKVPKKSGNPFTGK